MLQKVRGAAVGRLSEKWLLACREVLGNAGKRVKEL